MIARALDVLRQSSWMLIPHMPWVGPHYGRAEITRDMFAGLTVAAVLIPQAIGYALLAGLPPVHGLYAALFGGVAGSLWGNSRFLATGPIAIASLLTLTAVAPLAPPGSSEFIALVAALALMVGIIQIVLGLSRAGFLVRLVPISVLVGFSSAAALIIVVTQAPHLLGVPVSSGEFVFQMMVDVIRHGGNVHALTFMIGGSAIAALVLVRRAYPKLPAALIVLIAGIIFSYWLDFGSQGVELAGEIPKRLPLSDIPSLSPEIVVTLGMKALVIAMVGFMSSYAVVREFSSRTKEHTFTDQELIGQGFANLFSGLFRGYPVGGSLSRSAINFEAGAATAWSGVYAALIMVGCIVLFSSAFAYIPNAVIAAIVVVAVLQLVDVPHMHRMTKVSGIDGIVAGTTFAVAFLFRPDEAILIGVVLALALFVRRMMWVDVAEVALDTRWNVLRAIGENPTGVEMLPKTLLLRIGSSFFYGNAERLIEKMRERVIAWEKNHDEKLSRVVLDCAGIDFIDATGIESLEEFWMDVTAREITLGFIYPHRIFRDAIAKTGALKNVRLIHNIAELREWCGLHKAQREKMPLVQ